MGILKKHIDLICKNKKKNENLFDGSSLVIGQQSVYAEENEVLDIINQNNINYSELKINFSKKSKLTQIKNFKKENKNNINSKYLFSLLGSKEIKHLDFSPHEDAEIIFNLNNPIKKKFQKKFNNIIDMGSIEHIADPFTVLTNYLKMLKNNGYIIISTQASNMVDHGFYSFSPCFFFDFFNANNIKIINCYLRVFNPYFHEHPGDFYTYKKVGLETPLNTEKAIEIFIIAQKTKENLKFIKPIQGRYQLKNLNKKNQSSKIKKLILLIIKKYLHYKIQKFLFNFKRGINIVKLNK
jgi:2-polyprenyl-3-methyl-5-hydroxy-6-metoxy-1,4-benzoquinol methylase